LPELQEGIILPPTELTPEQVELCRRLDSLGQMTIQGQELSGMLMGAIYATREECRSNSDWMAQSAHSLREILYIFKSKKTKGKKFTGNWIDAIRHFGSVTIQEEDFQKSLNTVYGKIEDVAHHQLMSIEKYERLMENFQMVLLRALDRQVDIHTQIDQFFSEKKLWE
jgi:hypothetical protein